MLFRDFCMGNKNEVCKHNLFAHKYLACLTSHMTVGFRVVSAAMGLYLIVALQVIYLNFLMTCHAFTILNGWLVPL